MLINLWISLFLQLFNFNFTYVIVYKTVFNIGEKVMLIQFEKIDPRDMFVIPASLVDDFMLGINGEYIKVYLYILRNYTEGMGVDKVADALNMLETDVFRSLKFWESKGLLEVNEEDISIENTYEKIDKPINYAKSNKEPDLIREEKLVIETKDNEEFDLVKAKNSVDMKELNEDDDFKMLLFVAQTYLKRTFNQTDVQSLAFIYDNLNMSVELIEYLIEMCVSKDKKSLRYMEKIAIDWHRSGIDTVKAAKEVSNSYNSRVWAVMNAFGIKDRTPVKLELDFINKWFDNYAFSTDMVVEACNRTMMSLSKPSFNYTDSILTKWYDEKIRTISDIKNMDDRHKSLEVDRKTKVLPKTKNKFNNFEQRNDNINEQELYNEILNEF